MVRLAQSTGDGSTLWPRGCTSIEDCPNDLVQAVGHANYILTLSENLMEGEHPETWMWAFPKELDAHLERVKRKRDEKYGKKSDDDDDDLPLKNEYAEELRGG